MWTFAALKAADPGGDDLATIAATLNAETVTQTIDVPISTVQGYMLVNGIVAAADAWAMAHPDDTTGVLAVIRSLEGLLASPHLTVVEMTSPAIAASVTTMLGVLAAASIMTSDQRDAVLAMASATVPKWQPAVTAGDIQTARAQP
jgi:hypothetical protein